MKYLVSLALVVSLLGCAALQPAANRLLEPADPTNPASKTVLQKQIDDATEGTPYSKYAGNIGAGAALLVSILAWSKANKAEKATEKPKVV